MKYREALRAALDEEMERDPAVFVVGEGIGERGGSYKVTEGLLAKFGPNRVIDTPLSEAGFVGLGVGAAIVGQRPVVEMLFIDFLLLAGDDQQLAGDERRLGRGEEDRAASDVIGRPPATERRLVEDPLHDDRVGVLHHLGADPAGADRVDRDVRSEGQGHRLREPVHAGLRDDVLGESHRRGVVEP